jgi:tRNA-dihydrouridine synthase B
VRTARKHIGWYTRGLSGAQAFRHRMNTLDSTREQLAAVNAFFDEQAQFSDRLVYTEEAEPGDAESGPDTLDRLAA